MSINAQTVQQNMGESGGGIGDTISAHPLLIAALIGGGLGLFVLLRRNAGGSTPSSDASVGNVQIASLQDQLLRFSGEQSLRDQTTQQGITALGTDLTSKLDSSRQAIMDQANSNAMGNAYLQTGIGTYLQQLIVAYGGDQKTPAERDAIVANWRQMFHNQLQTADASYEASDGSQYRQWLAIRAQQGSL